MLITVGNILDIYRHLDVSASITTLRISRAYLSEGLVSRTPTDDRNMVIYSGMRP